MVWLARSGSQARGRLIKFNSELLQLDSLVNAAWFQYSFSMDSTCEIVAGTGSSLPKNLANFRKFRFHVKLSAKYYSQRSFARLMRGVEGYSQFSRSDSEVFIAKWNSSVSKSYLEEVVRMSGENWQSGKIVKAHISFYETLHTLQRPSYLAPSLDVCSLW